MIAARRQILLDPAAYSQRVLSTRPDALIAYWPLAEQAGSVAYGLGGRHGTYTGVELGRAGIGDGLSCPYFDGVNDWVTVTSALASVFNGATGSLAMWLKFGGVWSDGSIQRCWHFTADANNRMGFHKGGSNALAGTLIAGGTTVTINRTSFSPADWFHVVMTWDKPGDSLKLYTTVNGTTTTVTGSGLGTWAGTLTVAQLGAINSTAPWTGNQARVAAWTAALNAGDVARIARVR